MRAVHMVFAYYTLCGRDSIEVPQAWRTRDTKQVTCKRCLAAMAKEKARRVSTREVAR